MSSTACPCASVRLPAAELNALIRAFTVGRTVWTPEALAELAVLQAAWRRAVAREQQLAGAA